MQYVSRQSKRIDTSTHKSTHTYINKEKETETETKIITFIPFHIRIIILITAKEQNLVNSEYG